MPMNICNSAITRLRATFDLITVEWPAPLVSVKLDQLDKMLVALCDSDRPIS